jgi:toxin ParE1/3/4
MPHVGNLVPLWLAQSGGYKCHAVDASDAAARIRQIIDAVSLLETSPMIGRLAAGELRELVIGKRTHGYVALYRYVAALDIVLVLALRSRREAGYSHD